MFKRLFCALMSALGFGCGGTGQGAQPGSGELVRTEYVLPDWEYRRSDLLDLTEGTRHNPLRVNAPTCSVPWLQPPIWWQERLCDVVRVPPTVYAQSNGFASYFPIHVPGHQHVWKVAVNNEDAWDNSGRQGPPNQSAPLNVLGSPFRLRQIGPLLNLELYLADVRDNRQKLPYLAVNYTRGVQGDTYPRIYAWGAKPELSFTASLVLSRKGSNIEAQWAQVWSFWRDPVSGKQWLVRHDLYSPPHERTRLIANWNWPVQGSYYYPGAILGVDNARSVMRFEPVMGPTVDEARDRREFQLPLEDWALEMFPEFATIKPDFLGFEIAIEMGYRDYSEATSAEQWVSLTIHPPKLTGLTPARIQ